ncbi:MAG: hypothetical protein U0Q15_11125 [Kineosporiaceae bacterium]
MRGLSVRWSLVGTGESVAASLREYVATTSLERFTGMPGLSFKTWRMREGEWFEGTYVFGGVEEREAFQAGFTPQGATSPVSRIVGVGPELIEPFEVVAVAEGNEGFAPGVGLTELVD